MIASLDNDRTKALVTEELKPAVVLRLFILCVPILIALAGHIIMSVVTGDRHESVQIDLTAVDALLLHAGQHVLLIVVRHINSSYEVFLAIGLQGLLKLGIANVGLEGVIAVWVTVTHEGYNALSGFVLAKRVKLRSYQRNVNIRVVEQRHTEEDCLIILQLCKVFVIKMRVLEIAVVHKLLHACYYSSKLLARDNLQGLHINLAILRRADGMKQVARLIVVTLYDVAVVVRVLTYACTIDADVA